jgi:anti-sigma regulatory factor (Ser/Thr protein kinase)
VRERLIDETPAGALADVLTMVSELVSNAVRHGAGNVITLRLETVPGEVQASVQNAGAGTVAPASITAHTGQGLGLHIVDAIATEWDAASSDQRTSVSFKLAYC